LEESRQTSTVEPSRSHKRIPHHCVGFASEPPGDPHRDTNSNRINSAEHRKKKKTINCVVTGQRGGWTCARLLALKTCGHPKFC
jgi:hypothetical protein